MPHAVAIQATDHRTQLVTLTSASAGVHSPPAIVFDDRAARDNREIHDRVHAALVNSGHRLPHGVHITLPSSLIQLAPTTTTALAVVAWGATTTAAVNEPLLASTALIADLSLDGTLRPCAGLLATVESAHRLGVRRIVVPTALLAEAAAATEADDVLGASTLAEVIAWLSGFTTLYRPTAAVTALPATSAPLPSRSVPAALLRALEIAAAGGHHMLLHAAPDAGATLVAEWLHHLLPDLTALQLTDYAATGGQQDGDHGAQQCVGTRPPLEVLDPGYPDSALLGGLPPLPPGVLARAHHGLLLAPNLTGHRGTQHDILATVLGRRKVHPVTGTAWQRPAAFQLLAIARSLPDHAPDSPCCCDDVSCVGALEAVPLRLLDRVAMHVALSRPLIRQTPPEVTDPARLRALLADAQARVRAARTRAHNRWSRASRMFSLQSELNNTAPSSPRDEADTPLTPTISPTTVRAGGGAALGTTVRTNSEVPAASMQQHPLPASGECLLHEAHHHGALSAHGVAVVRRMAWTGADLDGHPRPTIQHVAEALVLRASICRPADITLPPNA